MGISWLDSGLVDAYSIKVVNVDIEWYCRLVICVQTKYMVFHCYTQMSWLMAADAIDFVYTE